jgi:prepilin-type N-terminal cleavage/methylation domain-containing protein
MSTRQTTLGHESQSRQRPARSRQMTSTPTDNPIRAARRGPLARRFGRGLGLIEMMIALAISAAVLTAVATAVDVSFKSYSVNQENSNLMQRARLAMYRITSDIRVTALHQPPIGSTAYTDFTGGKITTTDDLYLYMDVGKTRLMHYQYDAVNKLLMCITFDGDEFVVARGVEAFTVKMEPMKSPTAIRTGGAFDLLMRATITLTVKTTGNEKDIDERFAGQTVTLSTSVMPRRNVW